MTDSISGRILSRDGEKSAVNPKSKTILTGITVIALAAFLPWIPWFRIGNAEELYAAMGLKASAIAKLGDRYHALNFLSFVQDSKQGVLGPFAFILLLLAAAAMFFLLYTLFTLATGYQGGKKGSLGLLSRFQKGMIFTLLSAGWAIWMAFHTGELYSAKGISASPLVWGLGVLSLGGYLFSKRMEKREFILQKEHGFLEEVRRNWILFLFLIPCFVFFLINNYLPMFGIYFAFTKFNFRDSLFASPFVGFDNFQFLFRSEIMHLTWNTIAYNVVFILVGNVLQILFAILISHVTNSALRKTSQTLIFMPYFVSYVILRVLVFNMFEYDVGLINNFLVSLGRERLDFYNNPGYWPWLITIFYLWKNIGYGMVVYLATITGIPTDFYEAAQIDGANIYQQIWYITVPQLKPTFIILLLYALGGIMKGQFELFYQLVGNNGTLFSTTDIFDTYVYRITTTQPLSMGLGTAAGLFQSLFGFVIIMLTNFLIKRKNPEYALF